MTLNIAPDVTRDVSERAILTAAEDDEESAVLLAPRRKTRAVVLVGAIGLGLACALVLWKATSRCVAGPVMDDEPLVSLYQLPDDLVHLSDRDDEDDKDAIRQWMATAKTVSDAAAAGPAHSPELRRSLQRAMSVSDPEEAKKIVDRAMARAVKKTVSKRRDLQRYIKAQRRNLKGGKRIKGEPIKDHVKKTLLKKYVKTYKTLHTPKHNFGEQKDIAQCTIDVLMVTTSIAGIAANINDASKTCWGVRFRDIFYSSGAHGEGAVHSHVCSINVLAVVTGFIAIASTLSEAADFCAVSIIPNVDALCSQSVTGLVTALAKMAGAGLMAKNACVPHGWYSDVPKHLVPSNVGANDDYFELLVKQAANDPAKLAEINEAHDKAISRGWAADFSGTKWGVSAPARQLLFGGGKASTATQCSVEILAVMWGLANAAQSINRAANHEHGGMCPPKNILTGKDHGRTILYKVPQTFCTVEISGALVGFLSAITYIELAIVNCADTLDLKAICGAGIVGMMGAAAGIAKAGGGLYMACQVAQRPIIHAPLELARHLDKSTNGALTKLLGADGDDENFGRRLKAYADDSIEELKRKYNTPQEVFDEMGMDLEDKTAPWANMTMSGLDLNAFNSLVEEHTKPEPASNLFGGKCSN